MRRDDEIDEVWGVKVDEFKEKIKTMTKNVNMKWPRYCEEVPIF